MPNSPQTAPQAAASQSSDKVAGYSFPDPSLTIIEFGDALGLLLASRTERDLANRRLVLKKVGYIRMEPHRWGATAFGEVWIRQNEQGLFVAEESHSGCIFRQPSRRRYEVAFLSREIFDCAIQCLKDRKIEPIYDLICVNFANRQGFSLETGGLLAPDDYAAEPLDLPEDRCVPAPTPSPF